MPKQSELDPDYSHPKFFVFCITIFIMGVIMGVIIGNTNAEQLRIEAIEKEYADYVVENGNLRFKWIDEVSTKE